MGSPRMLSRPRVGISRCLLGDEVRYDGRHKLERLLTEAIGRVVEWVPVCPEVETGMGVPREPIQLVARADGVPAGAVLAKLVGVTSGTDWTARMARFARRRARELRASGLSGFVLKAGSPSCGLTGVDVHRGIGQPRNAGRSPRSVRAGRGLFADAVVRGMPLLPIEEESRLRDPDVRDHFLERVFACSRVRAHFSGPWTMGTLVRFHGRTSFSCSRTRGTGTRGWGGSSPRGRGCRAASSHQTTSASS